MKHDDRYAILAHNAWWQYMRYVVGNGRKITEDQRRVFQVLEETIPLDIQKYSRWKMAQYWTKQMLPPMVALALSIVALLKALLK